MLTPRGEREAMVFTCLRDRGDGRASVEEIRDMLYGVLPSTWIVKALRRLARKGYVCESEEKDTWEIENQGVLNQWTIPEARVSPPRTSGYLYGLLEVSDTCQSYRRAIKMPGEKAKKEVM